MSAASVRRLKDRGASTITPISDKPSFGTARKFSDKENPNPNPNPRSRVSGSTQRPAIKPMLPRISNAECESRPKSRPRGRSPSPSDFTKILSDLRRAKVTGEVGSAGKGLGKSGRGFEKKGVRDLGNGRVADKGLVSGFRVYSDVKKVVVDDESDVGKVVSGGKCKKMDALAVNHVKSSISDVQDETIISANVTDKKVVVGEESDGGKLVRGGRCKKMDALAVNHVKSSLNDVQDESFSDSVIDSKGEFGSRNGVWKQSGLRSSSKCIKVDALPLNHVKSSKDDVKDESFSDVVADSKGEFGSRNGVMKQSGLRSVSDLNVYGGCKEKGVNVNEGESQKNKHASRLQAKLAYLEGKVKKIASDIKKTKEILDMNNTDASKVMLSDIQDKISGIEEGMGKAIADFHTNFNPDGSSKSGDSERIEAGTVHQRTMRGVNHQTKQPEPAKLSAKGLSGEELEARLFPHHKLLRNRPSLKLPALDNSQSPSDDDENPITIEFLASLNKDQSWVVQEVHEAGDAEASTTQQQSTTSLPDNKENAEVDLEADERLDDFDDRENKPKVVVEEEMEDDSAPQLMEIGRKTSTGGWFVSEGESLLLAHDDGSCSFYDVANQEEKAEYRPPSGIPKNLWKDCWIIRAPSADGCSGKYVVAASAGNTMDSGFCSWDFYTKDVKAFHTEDNRTTSRLSLGSLRTRNALAEIAPPDNNRQWWYRPCGPLMVSTASCQRSIKVFDIRDGEQVMKWDVQKPVLGMDYCSPLQWRNRGKLVVAETEGVSLWDVSSQSPEALLSVSTSGRRISALHVNNTDGELGGGVRQRVSSSEAEGNDGVFCTVDSINILDFRHPSGIGLKLPKIGVNVESVFSRGDSVFLGCNSITSGAKKNASSSQVLQFSLRKQGIISTYQLPESNAHSHHKAITQVWGNSSLVMATCGLGLFVFDAAKEEGGMPLPSFAVECGGPLKAKEVVGPNDLYLPSFDYHSAQVLLISRDRPAMWRHLL